MTSKAAFFEGWSWFKFNNFDLAPGANSKFYMSVAKGVKLKVRKIWGLNPTFVEDIGEKLIGGAFLLPSPSSPSWSPHGYWFFHLTKKDYALNRIRLFKISNSGFSLYISPYHKKRTKSRYCSLIEICKKACLISATRSIFPIRNRNKICSKNGSKQGSDWRTSLSDGWAFIFEEVSKTTRTFVVSLSLQTPGWWSK